MSNTNNRICARLAAAGVLSLLMSPSSAIAASEDLSLSIPEKYFRLNRCDNCVAHNPESRTRYPLPSEASDAQPAAAESGQGDSMKELSQKTADPTSDIALVFTQLVP